MSKEFADAHESETAEGADKNMDLCNNAIGRNIGNKNSSSSNSTIKNIVVSYCDQGRVYRVVNNQLVFTDSTGKK